jgi:hypothetical protein
MAGLGGWGFGYTIGEFDPGTGWRALAAAGSDGNLERNRDYKAAVEAAGQRVALRIDTVRVVEHVLANPLVGGQLGLFTWGPSHVRFGKVLVREKPSTVFVVMQFSEPYKQLYDEVICPVAQAFRLRPFHVGEVFAPGMILRDIAQGIIDAKIVVAEITPANQNVFYELGYAHALGKPTILLAEKGKQLPFDISGYRVLFYENTIAGKKIVEEGFKKHLTAILNK